MGNFFLHLRKFICHDDQMRKPLLGNPLIISTLIFVNVIDTILCKKLLAPPELTLKGYQRSRNIPVNVGDLARFENGAEVTPEILQDMGILKKLEDGVKILGNGELTNSITVKASKFSKAAKEKIEAAGGKAEVI